MLAGNTADFRLMGSAEVHVRLEWEHTYFGIFHALNFTYPYTMIDGLQSPQEKTVTNNKDRGGIIRLPISRERG